MATQMRIPWTITFRIYFTLALTLLLFTSVYSILYVIGSWFASGTANSVNYGIFAIILGGIPLAIALFARSRDTGLEAEEKDFPELFGLVREVSGALSLPMPSAIFLLPGEEIYVKGVFSKKLGIGIAGLRAISQEQLKAILCHEFGHFYGKDTAVGSLLARIQISLESSTRFGKGWWNLIPFMEIAIFGLLVAGFAKLYSLLFRVIISLYSRQVEYRADYIAASIAGREQFAQALLNYSAYTVYFTKAATAAIVKLLKEEKAYVNIYEPAYKAYSTEAPAVIRKITMDSDSASVFASYPSLASRIERLDVNIDTLQIQTGMKHNALSLIKKREQVEKELTRVTTGLVQMNVLYREVVAREGRCTHCQKQCRSLQEFVQHEAICEKNPAVKR